MLTRLLCTVFLALFFFLNSGLSQTLERKDVADKYKWNLEDYFKSTQEWSTEKERVQKEINNLTKYKGHLAESGDVLFNALTDYFKTLKGYYKLADYSSRLSDLDLRVGENQALNQQATALGTAFGEATSFMSPEILQIDEAKLNSFYKAKPGLEEFRMYLTEVRRLKEHTLSASEEKILASFGTIAQTPSNVYSIFNNAEQPVPEVTLSTGEKVDLSSAAYTKYRSTGNREDREKIFQTLFTNYQKFQNTIGANLAGKIQGDYVFAKNRNYKTSMEASLTGVNVPVTVYENLVAQINKNLPTLHRFLDLKKKMLGVDTLHYYDLYTPIVKEVDLKFTVEEGEKVILEALKPMGQEYHNTLKTAFDNRWIDYMPTTGKRSGAYSSGASYDVHPLQLVNWNDDYESLTTNAHELGHTMHSYFSNKNQTFANSNYPIFVAEIASTINETLLNNYMVNNVKSKEEKLFLLGSYLELMRQTIFRQTMFAEFEWELHKIIEKDEPLTGEQMSTIYYGIVKKYYGNDEGKCIVDPYIAYEWAYIPHFINYSYYVYQYSTSLIYATAFAEKIVKDGQPAVDNFFKILNGGSSDYPLNLIKKAGIDPLTSEAFEITMNKMNTVMDQIEELIK